ncbi:MAG: hypothetical protein FJW40_23195 [Acidobacteria bacterium]|nr:hypothetical protein [Acidobacteriota bacterium]
MTSILLLASVVLSAFLTGCATAVDSSPPILPAVVSGVWTRKTAEQLPVTEAPESISLLGVKSIGRADYEGPMNIRATVYQMSTPASAFESVQRWRPSPGRFASQKDALFIVVETPFPDQSAVKTFLTNFEKGF